MSTSPKIRKSLPDDWQALYDVYGAAFPDEELRPVVKELLALGSQVLSLVALIEDVVVGHVLFTRCAIGSEGGPAAWLLAPLAITPDHQKSGCGTALVREGIAQVEALEAGLVLVLGDPAYYGRFGFGTESQVLAPFDIPSEWSGAWQSIRPTSGESAARGRLKVPDPWNKPVYWAP